MLELVINILAVDYINLGGLMRVRRCSKAIRHAIEQDYIIWKSISPWKNAAFTNILKKMQTTNRICRECGNTNGRPVGTTKRIYNHFVVVCNNCTFNEGNYSQMIDRKQIKSKLMNSKKFVKRYKHVLENIIVCKHHKAYGHGYLYWASQVNYAIKATRVF